MVDVTRHNARRLQSESSIPDIIFPSTDRGYTEGARFGVAMFLDARLPIDTHATSEHVPKEREVPKQLAHLQSSYLMSQTLTLSLKRFMRAGTEYD